MKKTLLVINPNAGQHKSKSYLYHIISTFSKFGILPTVYLTKCKDDAKCYVAENAHNYDYVVCYGGDGTLNETVNGIIANGHGIPLGYIPAGSTNDFAASLGIPPAADICAKSIALGTPSPLDIGCFNRERYFCYVASFGAFTKASYNTPQNIKNALGHAAYIIEGAKMIPEIKPFYLKCSCDGETLEGNFLFGAVSNTTSIGGIKLFDDQGVKFDDGLFELILLRYPETIIQTKETVDDFFLRNYHTNNIVIRKGKDFKLEFSRPIDFSLDGEYGNEHTNVEISVKSSIISLLNRR